jgi:pilus assembly protein CpaC
MNVTLIKDETVRPGLTGLGDSIMIRTEMIITRLSLVFALTFIATPAFAATVRVAVGQQRVVERPSILKVAIGNPKVADVRALSTRQILVTGVSSGRTSLTIFGPGGSEQLDVHVTAQDLRASEREVSRLIRGLPRVKVREMGERLVLQGEVRSVDEHRRLSLVREMHPSVINMVTIAASAKSAIADGLTERFRKHGYDHIEALLIGPTLFVEGTVPSSDDLEKASEIIKSAGVGVENLIKVGNRRMVLIECQFVEVRRSRNDLVGVRLPLQITGKGQLGINITRGFIGPVTDSGGASLDMNGETPFSFGLQFNSGYGRLLAQPRRLASAGEQAHFLAGGEVPIVTQSDNGTSVEWKEFGVMLAVTPLVDRLGNINMRIKAEVSHPDSSVAVLNIPGFRTRRVETSVSASSGETIVLSGIYNNDEQKDVSKFPGLGHIPIIGELFKSRAWKEKKSELMVLLTPRLVTPASDRVRRIINDARRMYDRSSKEVRFNIWD